MSETRQAHFPSFVLHERETTVGVAALKLFADPNNWQETEDGQFIWKPFMNYVERDPVMLASDALK